MVDPSLMEGDDMGAMGAMGGQGGSAGAIAINLKGLISIFFPVSFRVQAIDSNCSSLNFPASNIDGPPRARNRCGGLLYGGLHIFCYDLCGEDLRFRQ